jgi:CDGSH-type Zn-finger protein/uncharacterized Fe-S cluster protein YjdI
MSATPRDLSPPTREQLVHLLYEAAELEHNLMCTYLYAAFSLRRGEEEGLSGREAEAVERFRQGIVRVAVEEMGHLVAVWNITAALGAQPRFGRGNFPLDPGALPAGMVVKLAPFSEEVLQHFIHLERPSASTEREGRGFEPNFAFKRQDGGRVRLVPMPLDYETAGAFYEYLDERMRAFIAAVGEKVAFAGDPALQLSAVETGLAAAKPVICAKTATSALHSIVLQGEGAPEHSAGSHFQNFITMRDELRALTADNPRFSPSFPAAVNPVLRPPQRESRVWIEDEGAAATVDLANTGYALMLRLLAYTYVVPRPSPEKSLAFDLSLALMRAVTALGERAARLPAGPSHPDCHAGMSFTALRDAAPLPPGPSAGRFFCERLAEMAAAATELDRSGDARTAKASRILGELVAKAERGFAHAATWKAPSSAPSPSTSAPVPAPPSTKVDGVERVEGKSLTLVYEGGKCIHSRFCVTWGPNVFLANVQGPWIHPDAMDVEALAEIAHACPSGAIRYERKDGKPNEAAPPVNLLAVREAGPYAVRAELVVDGAPTPFRATLCRCGASKHKPYCDGSHKEVGFAASGEPPTGAADMLAVRNGPLSVDPELDGPLRVRGNLEITSGTGRVVARVTEARLCRCGGSANKPFCDGTHARIGFRSS